MTIPTQEILEADEMKKKEDDQAKMLSKMDKIKVRSIENFVDLDGGWFWIRFLMAELSSRISNQ